MHVTLLISLSAACAIVMWVERMVQRRGKALVLQLTFKGDIKRESRWLAQWGQAVCTVAAAGFVLQLDTSPDHIKRAIAVCSAVLTASLSTNLLKRIFGRVRPNREQAGQFLGPTWRHANYRESFPSSHSACAVCLSVSLILLYPQAAIALWTLAIICAGLRYLLDAHWLSDVLGGMALGYAVAIGMMWAFGLPS